MTSSQQLLVGFRVAPYPRRELWTIRTTSIKNRGSSRPSSNSIGYWLIAWDPPPSKTIRLSLLSDPSLRYPPNASTCFTINNHRQGGKNRSGNNRWTNRSIGVEKKRIWQTRWRFTFRTVVGEWIGWAKGGRYLERSQQAHYCQMRWKYCTIVSPGRCSSRRI